MLEHLLAAGVHDQETVVRQTDVERARFGSLRSESKEARHAQAEARYGRLRTEVVETVRVEADGLFGAGVAVGSRDIGPPRACPFVRQTVPERDVLVDQRLQHLSHLVYGGREWFRRVAWRRRGLVSKQWTKVVSNKKNKPS